LTVRHFTSILLNITINKTRLNRKEYIDNVAVNDVIDNFYDVSEWWNQQATKHEDVRHLAFKKFNKYESQTRIEKWIPDMFMFHYTAKADTFIMNYHGEDGTIWPINFVHDARVQNMLCS
jgi:hypothetical protein